MPDKILERLESSAADIAATVTGTAPAAVRARADRRQRRTHLLASALAVFVLGGGFAASTLGLPKLPGPADDPVNVIVMPHEGEPGWQRSDDPSLATAYLDCLSADVTSSGRKAVITMTGPGQSSEQEHSPSSFTEQLLLFGSDTAAAAALETIRQVMPQCGWRDPMMGGQLEASRTGTDPAARYQNIQGFRRGHAVFVVYQITGGAGMSSPDNASLDTMKRELCQALRICPAQLEGTPSLQASNPPNETPSPWPSYPPSAQPTAGPSTQPSSWPSNQPSGEPKP